MKTPSHSQLTDEELRQKALELYEQHWKPKDIIATLGCSKTWLFKWIKRSQQKDETWYQSESRAPKNTRRRVNAEQEQLVIETRKKLIAAKFHQYGPQAIYYDLQQQGHEPPPVWEIARILKRKDLAGAKKKAAYVAKGKKYPYADLCLCQQMDFVGPRYLRSKERCYFFTIIDCDTHWAKASVLNNKTAELVCEQLVEFWKITGTPDFLQMDNDLSFWGSLRDPHAFGKVIRLCLLLKIMPVFIPLAEPWRNGIIEHFNDVMQENVLKDSYENIDVLKSGARQFDAVHNQTHHYSSQQGMTPMKAFSALGYPVAPLASTFKTPTNKLPVAEGEIHIIRFIRSDLKFHVFDLSFPMPKDVRYEYVRGIIVTHENCLMVYNDRHFIKSFHFPVLP